MSGDKTVPQPSCDRKAGNPAITPESEAASETRPRAEHPEDGFRAAVYRSVGLDQVNGGAKTFDRYVLSKIPCGGLGRGELNQATRCFLPSPNPAETKGAVTVIDKKRPLWRSGTVNQVVRATNGFQLFISWIGHGSRDWL
jgi:hypothetical protein